MIFDKMTVGILYINVNLYNLAKAGYILIYWAVVRLLKLGMGIAYIKCRSAEHGYFFGTNFRALNPGSNGNKSYVCAPQDWVPFLLTGRDTMKNRKSETCVKCGKERPIDPVKHLCHECWQDAKDAEQEAYYENHFGLTPGQK